MPESINSLSPDFRDQLLKFNLKPFTKEMVSGGLGLTTNINLKQPLASSEVSNIDDYSYPHNVLNNYQSSEKEIINIELNQLNPQENYGEEYNIPTDLDDSRLNNELDKGPYNGVSPLEYLSTKNLYNDPNQQIDISDELFNSSNITEQISSYITENGSLRGGLPYDNGFNVIGTILEGKQLGYSPDGLEPNFDIRSSIVGRALGPTIGDTPLGLIGGQQLINAMLANASSNIQEETLGRINLRGVLDSDEDFIVPNYQISVRDGFLGGAVDFFERLSGAQLKNSPIGNDADFFSNGSSINETLSQNLLSKYTGRGQINNLFSLLNKNIYTPEYSDERLLGEDKTTPENNKYYILNSGNTDSQFLGIALEYNPLYQTWDDNNYLISKIKYSPNSVLNKTQNLFKNNNIKTLINRTKQQSNIDEIQSSVINGNISKGNAVTTDGGQSFCRTWTTRDRYDRVQSLQKHRELYGNEYHKRRKNSEFSILDNNGFPKISPYATDNISDKGELKKYMLSIENLAWAEPDIYKKLPDCERGNGVPSDGKGRKRGRIMWFPPYDISFNDNAAVDLNTSNFIGRGEPIYTYNNTERTSMLSFKVVVDHHSLMNENWNQGKIDIDDNEASTYLFGCKEIPPITINETEENIETVSEDDPIENSEEINIDYNLYFPNDSYTIDTQYETGDGIKEPTESDGYFSEVGTTQSNITDFGLNSEIFTNIDIGEFENELDTCKSCKIVIKGYASSQGSGEDKVSKNQELSLRRAEETKTFLMTNLSLNEDDFTKITVEGEGETSKNLSGIEYWDEEAKKQRYVSIEITNDPEKISDEPDNNAETNEVQTSEIDPETFYNECKYFRKLEDTFVFSKLSEKLDYFHPAFHSTTPEGFNNRLNFLHQCTRQGPTNMEGKPNNLAFGRPPVCILRIGDFHHTKIMITNLTIDYEPLVWDLNPEGIGVQPMIANVTLNFNIMGGSSLQGPINQLQNAVSFNFFANTEMYDQRSNSGDNYNNENDT